MTLFTLRPDTITDTVTHTELLFNLSGTAGMDRGKV